MVIVLPFMVEIRDLTFVYDGQVKAVDNLSFNIEQGEILGLLGPNGAGKSTTVKLLMGVLKPTSGSVKVAGLEVSENLAEIRRRIGFMPQETALYHELTAQETLEYHAELYGVPKNEIDERISRMLKLAGLTDRKDDLVRTFSGGMKRRLALVRSILHDSDLLIFDEMSLGVDVQSRNLIWNRVRDMKREGRTILFCTNYMDEAEALADRLIIIDHGRIITEGTPRELKQQHVGEYLIEVMVDDFEHDEFWLSQEIGLDVDSLVVGMTGSTLITVKSDDGPKDLPRLITAMSNAGVPVKQVSMREPSLDDVFLSLTGSRLRD